MFCLIAFQAQGAGVTQSIKFGGKTYHLSAEEQKFQDKVIITKFSYGDFVSIPLDKNTDGIIDYWELSTRNEKIIWRNFYNGYWRHLETLKKTKKGILRSQYYLMSDHGTFKLYRSDLKKYAYNHFDEPTLPCSLSRESLEKFILDLKDKFSSDKLVTEIKAKLLDSSCLKDPFKDSAEDIAKAISDVLLSEPPGSGYYLQCLKNHNLE
jgi:hypothetical protein